VSINGPSGKKRRSSSSISEAPIFDVFRALTVFVVALFLVLALLALVPELVMGLPEMLGYEAR
jgi:TRAP-type C4-dicarboxylate transport system permease large subunit